MERLGNSHFAPIDTAIMTGVISLIVQGYFCYRIWILMNRRLSSWICWIIVIVCIPDSPRIFQTPDVFLNSGCGDSGSRRDVDEHHSQYCTHLYRSLLSYTAFSRSGLRSMWFPRQLYMYAYSFRSKWPTTSYPVMLVMVYTECHGGHSDRGGNDATGTGPLH